ncbi:MAG: Cafeteria roenbergensis virus, partial [Bacteroidota bacterium]
MDEVYDYIIIGGGPSGISMAHMLSKTSKKILLLEKESVLGGCHRVKRVNNLFTHHSPMVYTDSAINFRKFLDQIDYDFYDNFSKYKFSLFEISTQTLLKSLTLKEYFLLIKDTIILLVNDEYLSDISLKKYLEDNNFTIETIDTIDRLCRLSDGGDIEKFSVNLFLELLNQNIFYNLYQTKEANDKGLFKKWEEYLKERFVDIKYQENIIRFDNVAKKVFTNTKEYSYDKLIFATPVKPIK